MSRLERFLLPDLGEGLTEGEIIRWLVAAGDTVEIDQPIVEVETAKAAVEVPSPFAGVVAELFHAEGVTVDVGSALIAIDTRPDEPDSVPPSNSSSSQSESEPVGTLVGYGPDGDAAQRRRRARRAAVGLRHRPQDGPARPAARQSVADDFVSKLDAPTSPPSAPRPGAGSATPTGSAEPPGPGPALTKPPVRKLARDLGVDLRAVAGTGPDGTVTREDVMAAVGQTGSRPTDAFAPPVPGVVTAAGFDAMTREMRIPVGGVRRHTASAMVASAFTAPHVSEFLTVDVTRTVEAVGRLRAMAGWEGVRIGPLLFVAKAIMLAIHRNPTVNATWVEDTQEIVVKDYVNLGIAAATRRGLVVPNVKAADQLTLRELADALTALVTTAREGKSTPSDLVGGTITITNIGVFGVDSGTPILNPGEAMIVAFGQIAERPWVIDGAVVPRQVTTLSISFDHRVVDGEVASRFLADVGTFLRDPEAALLAWA